jgi:hypothetical protein
MANKGLDGSIKTLHRTAARHVLRQYERLRGAAVGELYVRRKMKKRRPPTTMQEALDFLLYDICVDLGFCLPPDDNARICTTESWDADAFVEEVFRAEGMDSNEHLKWKREIRNRFIDMFGSSSVDSETFQRRLKCDS